MKPISVQLYSLRDAAAKGFNEVLERVARIGFKGVEPAGFHGMTPKEFRRKVENLGMVVSSSHGPWANPENLNEVIDTLGVLGLDIASTGYGPDDFKDREAIQKTAEIVNGMIEKLARANIKLFLHNHHWEFSKVEGAIAYEHFVKLCPNVLFEIDTYWACNFGANDPAEQVEKYRDRTILLHIKDGHFVRGGHMVAVGGSGRIDFQRVIAAADPLMLRWLIVELDSCETDMFEAVEKSYRFLISHKLAEGNR